MRIQIWSPLLRLLHWGLAISTLVSFATHEGGGKLHEISGYLALAFAVVRIALGFLGPGVWSFRSFVKPWGPTLSYARDLLKKQEPRYLGHNPIGAWMVLALLVVVFVAGASGWLYVTDRFWGYAWLEAIHSLFGHAILILVALHLLGVAFTSIRHRENLLASMLHGKKHDERKL